MIIQEQGNFFSLEIAITEDWYGFVPFSIRSASKGFSGEVHYVDVQLVDLENFLNQLAILDEQRQGKATLKSSDSPESREFQLEVFSTDKLGHMALGIEITADAQGVQIGFEIDPSNIPYFVEQFTEMISALKQQRAS